jgi:hypothetical protein
VAQGVEREVAGRLRTRSVAEQTAPLASESRPSGFRWSKSARSRLFVVVTAGSHTHRPSIWRASRLIVGAARNSSEFSMVSPGQSS